MARKRKGRPVDGVFLLDKPLGLSSNAALQRVRRIYDAAKGGHTGALDPLATGLLPICLGEATKFSQFLLDSDKTYLTTAKLGVRTETSDAEGSVVETKPVPALHFDALNKLLQTEFVGTIEQVPSIYSALKHQGQPLYKLARQGKQVEVKPRTVQIYSIELLEVRSDEVDLKVRCSKGTYIRSLVEDLGHALGCGAHVSRLHRTGVGQYEANQMMTLETLEELAEPQGTESIEGIQTRLDALLLPPWSAVAELPTLQLDAETERALCQGKRIAQIESPPGLHRLFGLSGFLGLGELDQSGVLKARRLVDTSRN